MARKRSGFHDTIEYIGPRPQVQKPRNFFGGWVIIVIALAIGSWFGRPLVPFLKAMQVGASTEQANALIASLRSSSDFGKGLAASALERSTDKVDFDSSYYKIPYPNGDVPKNKGMAADVIVRSFRGMKLDLQQLVHEDMTENFRVYPQLWNASAPDPSIDHRRVPNLQRFFEHKAETLPASRNAADYQPGDIILWSLANTELQMGIVVPGPGEHAKEPWVVHNPGAGMKWENALDYSIQKHFRYAK
jgi:uncharacterized protein